MSNVFSQLKAKFAANTDIRKHKILMSKEKNYKINLILAVCVMATGVFYLAEVNGLSTKGYKIRELERSISSLQAENKKLSVAVVEARSLATLNEKMEKFGLIQANEVDYLKDTHGAMALR